MSESLKNNLKHKVEQALDTIRPYLKSDNGDVLDITPQNVVKLRFEGACSSCTMSAMTFKAGVEETILRMVPEITAVEALNVENV
ncbi:MAG TPA: NifU family protein [Bacteroidia bacterium]|nr:NifU family protein [Bacteroidia bacterium]